MNQTASNIADIAFKPTLKLVVDNVSLNKSLEQFKIAAPLYAYADNSTNQSKKTAGFITAITHALIALLMLTQFNAQPTTGQQTVTAISVSMVAAPKKPEVQPTPVVAPKPAKPIKQYVPVDNTVKSAIAPVDKPQTEQKEVVANQSKVEQAQPPASSAKTEEKVESVPVYVSPKFGADYLHNPAPEYPGMSRRRGEQGRVMLKVSVNAQGNPESVLLDKSSGFELLDKSALEAVRTWKFLPATINNRPVSGVVIVPVKFSLES